MNDLDDGQKQALEACVQDSVSFALLFEKMRQHPEASLLFLGVIAPASMYIVESHRCLTTLFPEFHEYSL